MLVALSVDMEGASQLRGVREIFGCMPEYWETGKPRLEADVAAACEGLLAGGASAVAVLDNHGGNTVNVAAESLPAGARLETWHVYDLQEHGVDAMFQVGYHARGGVEGFLSHTYVPGLRLRVAGELISESHARAWAAEAPLLGIVGNDLHQATLGSLAETPYLVVQTSAGRAAMSPVFPDPHDGLDAIRSFAAECAQLHASVRAMTGPSGVSFEASMPNGVDVVEAMAAAGWTRTGDVEFVVELESWRDSREPLAAAMNAALAPFLPYWLSGFAGPDEAAAADQERVSQLRRIFDAWAAESQPQWYTEAADPLPAGVAQQLGG
jgi:D-amino peptidase